MKGGSRKFSWELVVCQILLVISFLEKLVFIRKIRFRVQGLRPLNSDSAHFDDVSQECLG